MVADSEKLSSLVREFVRLRERMKLKVIVYKIKTQRFDFIGERKSLKVRLGSEELEEVTGSNNWIL